MSRRAVGWGRGAAVSGLFFAMAVGLSADPHIRTGGIPADVAVATNQRFHIGDHITGEGGAATVTGADVSPIILSCQGGDVLLANDIRVIIPGTLPLTWKANQLPSVGPVIVGNPPNVVIGAIAAPADVNTTFPDNPTEKTIFIDVTANFNPGNNFTLGNLKVLNVDSTAAPTHIQEITIVGQPVPYDDVAWWMIANPPDTVAFAGGQQTLTPGTPAQALGALTITESNVAPAGGAPFNGAIWNDKDIRITIPAAVTGVTWNTGAISSLNSKIGAAVTTEDSDRTVVIPVVDGALNDFTQGESAVINGLTMNVSASAPDQTFSLIVRLAGPTHYTAHFTMNNVCKVEGWPKLVTTGGPAPQVFTMGAATTNGANITIQEASGAGPGSRKMLNGVTVDVVIPNTLNMEWAGIPGTSIAGGGSASVGVLSLQSANKILRIPITGDFFADQVLTLTGVQFANFTGQNTANQFLELELNGPHVGPEAFDTRPVRIGRPSISSTGDDVLAISGGTGTLNMITVQDDPVNAVLGNPTQVRIHISSTSNLTFTGGLPTLGGGFAGGAVSFEDGNKTMAVTWTAAPAANATGTISNAPVSYPASASLGALELWMAPVGSTTVTHTSFQLLIVGNLPGLASTFPPQSFTINDPDTKADLITITTDAGSFQLFQMGNSLQLIIPAGLNLQWKNPQTPTLGGSAASKMSGTINYPDPKTLEFPINQNWALNDDLTFDDLFFTAISGVSPPTGIQLRARVNGPIAATDTRLKAIGAPVLASGANQVFGIGDLPTLMSPIRITDHGTTPRILAGTTLRIRIPALYGMTWDPSSTPVATLTPPGTGTPGTGTLAGVPTFVDADSVLEIPILTSFSPGQTLDITGARFVITGLSGLSRLELEVNNSGVANVLDTRTLKIGTRPVITSVSTADINQNGSLDRVIVVFNEDIEAAGSLSISAGRGFTFGTYNFSGGSLDATKRILTLVLAETGLPDTSNVPALSYNSSVPGADLRDFDDGLDVGLTPTIPGTVDTAAPVILSVTLVDNNSDGRPDQAVVRFSETISGTPILSRWRLVDGNGSTDLLAGLTDSSLSIVGTTNNQLQFDLTGAAGTMGTPRFQYQGGGMGAILTDTVGNALPTLTNNTPPVANAGSNQSVVPSLVTLDGTASSDPDGQPLQFEWSYLGGPVPLVQLNLSGTTTSKPTFLATTTGGYTFQLKVSDFLTSHTAMTVVTVLNVPPVAHAGPDLTLLNDGTPNLPLNALLSSDANRDTITYQWKILSGPAYVDQTSPFPVLTGLFDVDGLYQLELQATDTGIPPLMSKDTMWVRVNSPGSNCPTADAGPDQAVSVNTLVTLDGRNSSDTDGGALTFAWSGPATLNLTNPDRPTFTPPGPGLYTFTLRVTDAEGHGSIPDSVSVLVYNPANLPPLAVANKLTLGTPAVGQKVTLDSGGSLDPEGQPLQYIWTQLRGARVALSDSSGPTPTFAATQPGSYEFQLTVTDGVQSSLPSFVSFPITTAGGGPGHATTVSLTAPLPVPAIPPAPNSGHVVNNPTLMQLGSTAAGTTHVVWTQEAGPSVPFPVSPADTSFTPGKRGVYRFNRTGWDAEGVVVTSQLVLIVDDPANFAPNAIAGTDQTATAGQVVTLSGSGTDETPATLRAYWTQIVGPPVALTNGDTLTPSFTPTTPGVYLFSVKVSDGVADSTTDFVEIVVEAAAIAAASGGGNGGCGSVGVDVLILLGLAAAGWRRRRL